MVIQFRYVASISDAELENNIVIPCIDEEGFQCILLKNAERKEIKSLLETDSLEIKLNRVLMREQTSFYVHIIKAKKQDLNSKEQFEIIFEYLFKKMAYPLTDSELSGLLTSLEDLFKITPDSNKRTLQIGVYGELLTLLYLYNNGYQNIVNKYHRNFYSKHDIEINSVTRMEVKSTITSKRIHNFSHDQIMRDDVEVVVSSCMLEESKEGTSLYQLFKTVEDLIVDPEIMLAIKKLKLRCGISDTDEGIKCSFEKAEEDIRFYKAKVLPKIPIRSVDGVTNITYDVDCSTAPAIGFLDVVNLFNRE